MDSASNLTEDLYTRYGFLIQKTCKDILKSNDDAQDALQIVFTKLLEQYNSIKDKERVVPWIFNTAKNHCFNVLRYNKKFADGVLTDDTPVSAHFDDATVSKDIIKQVLAHHSDNVRDAVYYTYIMEFDQREIQKACGMSPATVRRNLKKFRDSLPGLRKRLGL